MIKRSPSLLVAIAVLCLAASVASASGDPTAGRTPFGQASVDTALRGLDLRVNNGRFARVVLVSFDGLRADAVGVHTPTVTRLAREGVSAREAQTITRATTLPSHASMLTGVSPAVHGITWNRNEDGTQVRSPTVMRIATLAGLPVGLFVAKPKLAQLLFPGDVSAWGTGSLRCERITRHALPWLRQMRSGFSLVHFPDADSQGHLEGWMSAPYLDAVRHADGCLAEVLTALSANDVPTLVIVTADHGGHEHRHGENRPEDRLIPFVAWGTGVPAASIDQASILDVAPTILAGLGLPLPSGVEGRVVQQALVRRP
jgi:arylsulfatase A-like enzyme